MPQNTKRVSRPARPTAVSAARGAQAHLPRSFEAMVNGWAEGDRMVKFALAEAHFRQAADLKVLRAFKAYRQKYCA